jgi:Probable cobalt transporter subunit (CbtA)
MLVGLVAGVLALGFASLFGEPSIDQAVSFESQEAMQRGEPPEKELVSRAIQRSIGLATGVGVYSVAFGGLFGLAFAVAFQRIGQFGARATAALVAFGGFVTIALVPFLKYPANPPSVGNPATLDRRTALYFAMILFSVVAAIAALRLGRWLAPRYGGWNATLIAGGCFILVVAVVELVLPAVNEVPPGFPATVLWSFRLASLGTQLVLWTTLGLLFGAWTERSLRAERVTLLRPAGEFT